MSHERLVNKIKNAEEGSFINPYPKTRGKKKKDKWYVFKDGSVRKWNGKKYRNPHKQKNTYEKKSKWYKVKLVRFMQKIWRAKKKIVKLSYYHRNREKILKKKEILRRELGILPNKSKVPTREEWSLKRYVKHLLMTKIHDPRVKNGRIKLNLTVDYILSLFKKQKGICALSGEKMNWGKGSPMLLSIDRIDSKNGNYVEGEIQLVCYIVNMMKGDSSNEDFIKFCKMVAENN